MINQDNFLSKKAYHAMLAARDEMLKAEKKKSLKNDIAAKKYQIVDELQKSYDEAGERKDEKWKEYNNEQLKCKEEIHEIIVTISVCNENEDSLRIKAADPSTDPSSARVYLEGAEFYKSLAKKLMVERDEAIAKKRAMPRPDNHECEQILENLKAARADHAEALEEYHSAKNEFTLRKMDFDRLKKKYDAIRYGGQDDSTCTNRPKRLENDERLLMEANIPEDDWSICAMYERADGRVDIYIGDGADHGHVVMHNGQVEYSRLP